MDQAVSRESLSMNMLSMEPRKGNYPRVLFFLQFCVLLPTPWAWFSGHCACVFDCVCGHGSYINTFTWAHIYRTYSDLRSEWTKFIFFHCFENLTNLEGTIVAAHFFDFWQKFKNWKHPRSPLCFTNSFRASRYVSTRGVLKSHTLNIIKKREEKNCTKKKTRSKSILVPISKSLPRVYRSRASYFFYTYYSLIDFFLVSLLLDYAGWRLSFRDALNLHMLIFVITSLVCELNFMIILTMIEPFMIVDCQVEFLSEVFVKKNQKIRSKNSEIYRSKKLFIIDQMIINISNTGVVNDRKK